MSLGSTIKAHREGQQKIVSPILNKWLRDNPDGALVPSERTMQMILPSLVSPPRIRHTSFSSSSAGTCPRAQVLAYLAREQNWVPSTQMAGVFNDGKWRHVRWQVNLLESGALDQIEVGLKWRRMRTLGSMDGSGHVKSNHPVAEWRDEEFGFELKGVNPFTYGQIMKKKPGGRPPQIMPKHMEQVQRYMLLAGLKLFVVIYENKGTNEFHEWVIPADPLVQAASHKELTVVNKAIDNETLPPPLPSCLLAMGGDWKDCPFAGSVKMTGACMDHHTGTLGDPFVEHRKLLALAPK